MKTRSSEDHDADQGRVGVLLVDTSQVARAGLVELLKRRKSLEVVAEATNVVEALDAIAREAPDVVLIDMHSRDVGTVAMCRHLRESSVAAIVLLVSFITEERWRDLRAAGASGYLLKHIDVEALERDLVRFAKASSGEAPPN